MVFLSRHRSLRFTYRSYASCIRKFYVLNINSDLTANLYVFINLRSALLNICIYSCEVSRINNCKDLVIVYIRIIYRIIVYNLARCFYTPEGNIEVNICCLAINNIIFILRGAEAYNTCMYDYICIYNTCMYDYVFDGKWCCVQVVM